jgi:hypothetical protein
MILSESSHLMVVSATSQVLRYSYLRPPNWDHSYKCVPFNLSFLYSSFKTEDFQFIGYCIVM